jgi:uncharacterized protein
MSRFIDKRLHSRHKSAVNRERFIRRYKSQIQKAVSNAIAGRSITDIEAGESITIPAKDINEPIFNHTKSGKNDIVLPGNKEYSVGDKIKRPSKSSGEQGSNASNEGEGEDDFQFNLSKEEFLDIFFDNLELPDLVKTKIAQIPSYKFVRAGYTSEGIPANINIIKSLKGSLARRIAIGGPHKKEIVILEAKLETLLETKSRQDKQVLDLIEQIEHHKKRVSVIPFIDPFDVRYNNRVKQTYPTTQAVMFCLMDVSGSMDEAKKDIAKRFFILLYLFLTRNYEKIDIVFIRHHTSAKEVNENDFFYSKETGGTVVSSALDLMKDIIQERYPTDDWNIYGAQASDGDNWNNDSPRCLDLLVNDILPYVQYFSYVEIMPRHHQSLWIAYQEILKKHSNFSMENIAEQKDIYPVFRELFKKNQPNIETFK